MPEVKSKKGLELTKRLLELSGQMIEILPLGDPDGSFDWEQVQQKILTKEKAAKLLRLAQEIQAVRGELDKL